MKKVVASSSLNKRLISRLMSSRPVTETSKTFNLKGSTDFVSRSNDIFSELKSLESAHESWISKNNTHESFPEEGDSENFQFVKPSNCVRKSVNSVRQSRKCSSDFQFKKPMAPKIKSRNGNARNGNRKKWIKYSLEDIPLSSNSTNTSTALAFMDELRKRNKPAEEVSNKNEKLLFLKPKLKVSRSKISSNTISSASSSVDKNIKSVIKLDHLEPEDD